MRLNLKDIDFYLRKQKYPSNSTKDGKRAIRRKSRAYFISKDSAKLMYGIPPGVTVKSEDKVSLALSKRGPREVVFDRENQDMILQAFHRSGKNGGHLGRDRLIPKVQSIFFWESMTTDARNCVRDCKQCNHRKGIQKASSTIVQAPMEPHPKAVTGVWDQVGLNIMGPMKETMCGNRFIVTVTDYLSKWSEATATPDRYPETVAKFLHKVMLRMGFPQTILTDQDKEFNSALSDELQKKANINVKVSSVRQTRSKALVERLNRMLKEGLGRVVENWDAKLDEILYAYRTQPPQDSEEPAPFEVVFGREPRVPISRDPTMVKVELRASDEVEEGINSILDIQNNDSIGSEEQLDEYGEMQSDEES